MRIIALAGLPGTGKSALAQALATELRAPVFDKDELRRALFGQQVRYSSEQNDAAARASYGAAGAALRGGAATVVLDGRTYSRRIHVQELQQFARECGAELVLVECRCEPSIARERIEHDRKLGTHPAPDRTTELHDRLARDSEPIDAHLTLDTSRASAQTLARALLEHLGVQRGPQA